MKYSDTPTIADAWRDEIERFEPTAEDFDLADCAELADELELFSIQANEDPAFLDSYVEWDGFIFEYELWLALEQCCHESVLLPMGQRELRVTTCPPDMLGHLSYFFSRCPVHVKHHLALKYWVMVRADRARRTDSADWRPASSPARSPQHDTVFFRFFIDSTVNFHSV